MTATVPSLPLASGARAGAVPAIAVDQTGEYVPPIADVLITGGGINGISPRLRVDVGQTGFFAGREFRTFKELSIAASSEYVIKAVVPFNIILFGLTVVVESGQLRMTTLAGGTSGGTFSETLPVLGRNNMTERPMPFYSPQVVLTAGGTITGGTILDVVRLKADQNSNRASSVGSEPGDERGILPGTYHFRLENLNSTDPIAGVLSARWEERP